MTGKPTPGPWNVAHYSKHEKHIVALIDGKPRSIAGYCLPSDAHLIAAAPDLLEALKGLMPYFEGEHHPDHPDAVIARAAIQKATGA